jgi:hypothetical protein
MAKSSAKKAPWSKSNPRKKSGKASKHLSPSKKKAAKARAKRAGRPYPNLIDNMAAASKKKSAKKSSNKKSSKTAKKTTKKTASAKKATKKAGKKAKRKRAGASAAAKDPKGGLTAAGRRAFKKKDGSHLKPGVTKSERDMSPTEMRRKGSWAVRFYGRSKLPPLVDKNGEPTRLALSAHAWGEPVPKTVAAARRIARKGERLLDRYRKLKDRT